MDQIQFTSNTIYYNSSESDENVATAPDTLNVASIVEGKLISSWITAPAPVTFVNNGIDVAADENDPVTTTNIAFIYQPSISDSTEDAGHLIAITARADSTTDQTQTATATTTMSNDLEGDVTEENMASVLDVPLTKTSTLFTIGSIAIHKPEFIPSHVYVCAIVATSGKIDTLPSRKESSNDPNSFYDIVIAWSDGTLMGYQCMVDTVFLDSVVTFTKASITYQWTRSFVLHDEATTKTHGMAQNCLLQFHPIQPNLLCVVYPFTSSDSNHNGKSELQLMILNHSSNSTDNLVATTSQVVSSKTLDGMAASISWNPDGSYLAIAMNYNINNSITETVQIYRRHNNTSSTAATDVSSVTYLTSISIQSEDEDEDAYSKRWKCTYIHWFEANSIAIGYNTIISSNSDENDDDESPEAVLHIWDVLVSPNEPSNETIKVTSCTNLGDVIPFFDIPNGQNHTFYITSLSYMMVTEDQQAKSYPILFVAANVGSDIAIITKLPAGQFDDADSDPSDMTVGAKWSIVDVDSADVGLTTPVNTDDEFCFPTGMVVLPSGHVAMSGTDTSMTVYTPSLPIRVVPKKVHSMVLHDSLESKVDVDTFEMTMLPSDVFDPSDLNISEMLDELPELMNEPLNDEYETQDDDDTLAHTEVVAPGGTTPASKTVLFSNLNPSTLMVASPVGTKLSSPQASTTSHNLNSVSTPTPPNPGITTGVGTLVSPGVSALSFSTSSSGPAFGQTSGLGGTTSSWTSPPPSTTSLFPSNATPSTVVKQKEVIFGTGTAIPTFGSSSKPFSFASIAAASSDTTNSTGFGSTAVTNLSTPLKNIPSSEPQPSSVLQLSHQDIAKDVSLTPAASKLLAIVDNQENVTIAAQPTVDLSSQEAKAAKAFDLLDVKKVGLIPIECTADLLDELGEGFHGAELDDQVAAIDSKGTGQLDRAAVIAWYAKLSSDGNDKDNVNDASSLQSDELAEREQERDEARKAFELITSGKGTTINVEDFPKLIESLNTTYCEEEHIKTIKRLRNEDDKIELNDFLDWYVEWLFGGDESFDDDDDNGVSGIGEGTIASDDGWGDRFAQKKGCWKCEVCMVMNDDEVTKCAACETTRPGFNAPVETSSTVGNAPITFGSGGITFGFQGGFHFGTEASLNATTEIKATNKFADNAGFSFGVSNGSGFHVASTEMNTSVVLSEPEAKAAKAFDLLDVKKVGSISIDCMNDLLDELGEGFHGAELDVQLSAIDPNKSGLLDRAAVISWYVKLLSNVNNKGSDNDASSLQSDDDAERQEERDKARKAFELITSGNGTTINVGDFPTLIESLNTTYCEEEHMKTIKRLQNEDGKIELDDFLEWYVEWLFGNDESFDDDNDDYGAVGGGENTADSKNSWGSTFAQKDSTWKCEVCMVMNDDKSSKCAACETTRPGFSSDSIPKPINLENEGIHGGTHGGFYFGTMPIVDESNDGTKPKDAAENNKTEFNFGTKSFGGFDFFKKVEDNSQVASTSGVFKFSAIESDKKSTGITFGVDPDAAVSHVPLNATSSATILHASEKPPSPFVFPSAIPVQIAAVFPTKVPTSLSSQAVANDLTASTPIATLSPISIKGPTPFGTLHGVSSAPIAAAPPMSMKAPTPVQKVATTPPVAAAPPMSMKAPAPVQKATTTPPVAAAPPMSMKAPTPVQKVAMTPPVASAPPMSMKAPTPVQKANTTPFASPGNVTNTPIAAAPPISTQPPAPIHKGIITTPSVFPPMSKTAPTPFGSPGAIRGSVLDSTSAKPSNSVQKLPLVGSMVSSNDSVGIFPTSATNASPSLFGLSLSTNKRRDIMEAQPRKDVATIHHSSNMSQSVTRTNNQFSECAKQYEALIGQMHQSLTMVFDCRPKTVDSNLRGVIERHVHGTYNSAADIDALQSSLREWKGISASVLGRKTESSRQLYESQRIITQLSRSDDKSFTDFMNEPLDCQSEAQRRSLTARMITTKRMIGIAKSRYDVISALESCEGDKCLLSSLLSLYEDVKYFDERTSKTESKAIELVAVHRQSLGTSTRYHLPLKSKNPTGSRSDLNDDGSKRRKSIHTWKSIESEFQKLKMPPVRQINIAPSTISGNGKAKSRNYDKLLPVVQPTKERRSSDVFSPTLSTKSRDGWNSSSRITQQQMQQVSFSPPRELRETTLNFASPGALSEYGTDPEKVMETMRISKLGMPQSFEKKPTVSQASPLFQSSSTSAKYATQRSRTTMDEQPSVGRVREVLSSQTKNETNSMLRGAKEPSIVFDPSYNVSQTLATPEVINPGPRLGETTNTSSFSSTNVSLDSLASAEASHTKTSTSVVSSKGLPESDSPDLLKLLTKFLEENNPEKAHQAGIYLEKYNGREYELFAKLAKKYGISNPLEDMSGRREDTSQQAQSASGMIDEPSQSMESSNDVRQNHSSIPTLSNKDTTPFPSLTAQSFGLSNTASSTPFSSAPLSFGQVSNSFVNQQRLDGGNNTLAHATPIATSAGMFRGKSARELLTEFYREKNPSKISDVDNLLVKYQGREEEMFRNLAKKYSLDPTVFGLSSTPSISTISAITPQGISGTPLAFGQPTPLGGGTPFGMVLPSTPSFGSPPGAFGQTFGSAGTSAMGSTSFGALAGAPAQPGFGALASPQGAFGASSPFGGSSPFGAPRR